MNHLRQQPVVGALALEVAELGSGSIMGVLTTSLFAPVGKLFAGASAAA